jgi:anti-anti-sigma factor
MMDIRVTRSGTIDLIEVSGEIDLSNVADLDEALTQALSDDTPCCLLDLSAVSFLDSTVVHRLIRWQADAQLSAREALAVATGKDTPTVRILTLSGVIRHLPLFTTQKAAQTALLEGQRARKQRRLRWLTDADLATAHTDAQTASDDATQHLDDITTEEQRRSRTSQPSPRSDPVERDAC